MSLHLLAMPVAFARSHRYKSKMKPAARAIIVFGLVAAGCGTGHTVLNVVTAPVRVVHREIAGSPPEKPSSDVAVPGRPVAATPTPPPPVAHNKTKPKPSTSPSPRAAPNQPQPQFPVAQAVPGKAGLVYNPFDPKGGLIDVSGYAPGSKVKDPDSQKIFIVP
jgi:hypothetical protein